MREGFFERRRNNEIYEMRLSGCTLAMIAGRYGLTRERVRQICDRFHRRAEREARIEAEGVNLMWDLPLGPRVFRALERLGAIKMPIEEFCESFTYSDFDGTPNFGIVSLTHLDKTLVEHGFDVSHLRSSGYWEDDDASEHGG